MLTIRCDGRVIGTGTVGSRDVMYQDREFAAPFVRPMRPRDMDSSAEVAEKEAGRYLCAASSPLYVELAVIVGSEQAGVIVRDLPADARVVTIRDEKRY